MSGMHAGPIGEGREGDEDEDGGRRQRRERDDEEGDARRYTPLPLCMRFSSLPFVLQRLFFAHV